MVHTHKYKFGFEKKKSGKESQYMFLHPELDSDPPIGSDRESGCDINDYLVMLTGRGPDVGLRGVGTAAPTHTTAQGEFRVSGRFR